MNGIENRPPGEGWVYVFPQRVYSKDDEQRRFGVISFFMPGGTAVTVRQIFCRDWDPSKRLASSEDVVGKVVHAFHWADPNRVEDISGDTTLYVDEGIFGVVTETLNPLMVKIQVDESYLQREDFKKNGFWARLK